jgi:hypothetical protein
MGEAKRRRAAQAAKASQAPAQASSPRHWEVTRISGPDLGEIIRTRHPEAGHYLHWDRVAGDGGAETLPQ